MHSIDRSVSGHGEEQVVLIPETRLDGRHEHHLSQVDGEVRAVGRVGGLVTDPVVLAGVHHVRRLRAASDEGVDLQLWQLRSLLQSLNKSSDVELLLLALLLHLQSLVVDLPLQLLDLEQLLLDLLRLLLDLLQLLLDLLRLLLDLLRLLLALLLLREQLTFELLHTIIRRLASQTHLDQTFDQQRLAVVVQLDSGGAGAQRLPVRRNVAGGDQLRLEHMAVATNRYNQASGVGLVRHAPATDQNHFVTRSHSVRKNSKEQ
jgi:hypothetical protein